MFGLFWNGIFKSQLSFWETKAYVTFSQYLVYSLGYNIATFSVECWTIIWIWCNLFAKGMKFYHHRRKPSFLCIYVCFNEKQHSSGIWVFTFS